MKRQQTVFVGISGGVDSSVAALRLKQRGYNVVGVFIKVWQPDFIECNWEAERLDAMRVAAALDIPFLMCDGEAAYKQQVADEFISEYKAGRTPNPDVLCNKAVKFGVFYDFAMAHGADYVATGHYATANDGVLARGLDTDKDQSYFLWMIPQDRLKRTLFPVGDTKKTQIRREAEAAAIPVATKNDSQGICFLGHIDIPEFLSHYIDLTPGKVLNTNGEIIGTHQGAVVYTEGQRHGFTVTSSTEPHYVVARDSAANTITVATEYTTKNTEEMVLHNLNQFTDTDLTGTTVSFQVRYRQTPVTGIVLKHTQTELVLKPISPDVLATPGQSCVLYDGDRCLLGGIIG